MPRPVEKSGRAPGNGVVTSSTEADVNSPPPIPALRSISEKVVSSNSDVAPLTSGGIKAKFIPTRTKPKVELR